VTYTSNAGYGGPDSFTYKASDGTAASSVVTVTLAVKAPPTVALAVDHATAVAGSTLAFTASATDPDGGAIGEYQFTVDGSVVQTGAAKTLSRRFDAAGTHTVTVRAKDDEGQTSTATKTVAITKQPDGGGGGGGGGGGTGGDTSPPAASLTVAKQKLKAVLKKGLAVRATCGEHCTLSIQLVVDKATAKKLKLGKKATVIGKLTGSLDGGGQLKVKLTAKAKKALKQARSVKVSVRAVATDDAGNAGAPILKRVTLKR